MERQFLYRHMLVNALPVYPPESGDLQAWMMRKRTTIGWSRFLAFLRQLCRSLSIANSLHVLRQLVHFGPWRWMAIGVIRWRRPCLKTYRQEKSALAHFELSKTLKELRTDSFSFFGSIDSDLTRKLVRLVSHLPPEEYLYAHEVSEDVAALAYDPAIWNLLRHYFGCEPVLLESSLFVSKAEHSMPVLDQHKFHFDYAGWQSLNVFVYLTDVDAGDSYHQVIKGSHRSIGFWDILRGTLSEDRVSRRFEGRIQSVFGPEGSLFFENTEAFHRRVRGKSRRVMLNLLYASHRGLFSHGRASAAQIAHRDTVFQRARACVAQELSG
ncbi:hypothetical protein [Simiduia agarivorans]|uniref:Phytanoyl-CoA dioxygenase n=1 Tax=Simiduia agarivorans (strain DSM 21679 / JCM 13881 / BCRC 17597 / SA1) TaxID=1117647 RepID=R9S3B2_SIMAS|nr:hypothetical protein [Simiduia agarivorans]AGN11307.1 hypothetical protein M5M_07922 [Simiduia agarivorans SA1 = DSM 21679]